MSREEKAKPEIGIPFGARGNTSTGELRQEVDRTTPSETRDRYTGIHFPSYMEWSSATSSASVTRPSFHSR